MEPKYFEVLRSVSIAQLILPKVQLEEVMLTFLPPLEVASLVLNTCLRKLHLHYIILPFVNMARQ
jgi:hypothetical protein